MRNRDDRPRQVKIEPRRPDKKEDEVLAGMYAELCSSSFLRSDSTVISMIYARLHRSILKQLLEIGTLFGNILTNTCHRLLNLIKLGLINNRLNLSQLGPHLDNLFKLLPESTFSL